MSVTVFGFIKNEIESQLNPETVQIESLGLFNKIDQKRLLSNV